MATEFHVAQIPQTINIQQQKSQHWGMSPFDSAPTPMYYWLETSRWRLPVDGRLNKTRFRIILFYGNYMQLKGA